MSDESVDIQAPTEALWDALGDVEQRSRDLPWAKTQPWRRETHLWVEADLPVVDLHDLSVRLAVRAVDAVTEVSLDVGAVVFITGRGNHSGGVSRLRRAVLQRLQEQRFPVQIEGPGRLWQVRDRSKIASRPMGLLFWLMVGLLGLGILLRLYTAFSGG